MRQARAAQDEAAALLARASLTDDLTGIGNRRYANRLLDDLAPGDGLVLIDLDRFKEINDRHGHGTGDVLLSDLAAFLSDTLRDTGEVARYGGEEFLVVTRAGGPGPEALAERLLAAWRARSPLTTFSAGVAVHEDGASPTLTMQRADRALYAAKAAGRDRVLTELLS
jgi:diguanylate cyclase (GGDEF)-like protein